MLWEYCKFCLSPLSLFFWAYFIHQLYFIVGTRDQGIVSPDLMFVLALFLSVSTAWYSNLLIQNQLFLVLGLLSITVGTGSQYYKCYTMLGCSLCILSLYYREQLGVSSSFGVTPVEETRAFPNLHGTRRF